MGTSLRRTQAPEHSVLVVDDDRDLVRAVGMRLGQAGFRALAAFDGEAGLAIARRDRPAAIILDLRMPLMDGFALLAELHRFPSTAGIPAIVLSADAADRARLRALTGSAAYFVEKPYAPRDLIVALNAALAAGGRREAAARQPLPDATTGA